MIGSKKNYRVARATINFVDQEVKGQSHRRPKLDMVDIYGGGIILAPWVNGFFCSVENIMSPLLRQIRSNYCTDRRYFLFNSIKFRQITQI